ncbi:Tricin synthase 1 [Morella rubra]|uniref:Tricin synthase 1 n=1 Tax=Morella rubra TaxID=262757 RepID=A0A6A1VT41_9ROSI|nr:Tricin synthase 1 [Morella rubra]
MASSSISWVRHRCWPMLASRHVDFPWRYRQLMLEFHSVSATASVSTSAVKASSIRCNSRSFVIRTCSSRSNQPIRSGSTDAFVVVNDAKYGNKQVISVSPRLYEYVLANVREPEILRQLREETASMHGSQMQVSPDQAQLLSMLVQILGAERCIEVGVYTESSITRGIQANSVMSRPDLFVIRAGNLDIESLNKAILGYSSLAIALVLPESGHLVACERDAKSLEIAKKYYEQAGVLHKVDVKHGLAADALKSLILNGEACRYDFAFVDAEKRMNQEYFELLLQLVRIGGLIVIDNVLWHGKVADPLVNDAKTVSIRNFNERLLEDKRVNISMVGLEFQPIFCLAVQTPLH